MPNIKLKNKNDVDVIYNNINTITLRDEDNNEVVFDSRRATEPYVEEIYDKYNNLVRVDMHGSKSVSAYRYNNCDQLYKVEGMENVTKIEQNAFYNCHHLKSIIIPEGCTSIGTNGFGSTCQTLVEVINKSNLPITKGSSSYGGVAQRALNVKTSGESDIVNVNDYLFYTYNNVNYLIGYIGNDVILTLPENYNGGSYKIYSYAFYQKDIISITIPDGVSSIDSYAFYNCCRLAEVINLSRLNIGQASSSNGYAGYYAKSIKKTGTSDIVEEGGFYFLSVNGHNYLIGNSIASEEIVLPENFRGMNYELNDQPILTESYQNQSYKGKSMSVKKIIFPNNLSLSVKTNSFRNLANLQEISFSNQITMDSQSFWGGNISIVRFYSNNGLADWASSDRDAIMSNCKELYINDILIEDVTLPSSINMIGKRAFSCKSLRSINIPSTITTFGKEAFWGSTTVEKMNYEGDMSNWLSINFNDGSSSPVYYAENLYLNDILIENVVIPVGVTAVPSFAFNECNSISEITIPNTVKSFGQYVFLNSSVLRKVNFLGSIDEWVQISFGNYDGNPVNIGHNLYIDNILLENARINAQNIGAYVFYGNQALTGITLTDGVVSIGSSAFYGCQNVKNLILGDNIEVINSHAFGNCANIENEIIIPSSIITIDSNAFYSCRKVSSVKFLGTPVTLSNYAFSQDSSILEIKVPWAEGAVAGAPWGATRATITYNYREEE